jgi:hypothetical protein
VNGALVPDLGLPPGIWLLLTVLTCLAFFFKFQRFWSVRNLDLLLLFAPAPGLLQLVGVRGQTPWWAFVWLFLGGAVWVIRSLLDLGLNRRPLLDPNLNASGLACFVLGLLGLVVVETIILPEPPAIRRNPGDPHAEVVALNPPEARSGGGAERAVERLIRRAPPTAELKRFCAALAHIGIAVGLALIGRSHFERLEIGLAMSTCYLVLPYSRIALIDSGQLVPAALIVMAFLAYRRPLLAGLALGWAAAWMPACLGLLPLWAGFYWRRGARRFLAGSVSLAVLAWIGQALPILSTWARGLGARSLAEAGLLPTSDEPRSGSFWEGVDPAYRLPVLVAYVALVIGVSLWPASKNLGQLIALTATLLIGSQFWYLDEGGTLVALYLPAVLLLVFRPNLTTRHPPSPPPAQPRSRRRATSEEPAPA